MPTMTGFSDSELKLVRSAALDARLCLDAALNEVFFDNGRFASRMGNYFSSSEATNHSVMKTVNSMKIIIGSGVYTVKRGGDNSRVSAEAENFPQDTISFGGTAARIARTARLQGTTIYEGKRVNVVEGIMEDTSAYGAAKMELFDAYFGMPYKLRDAQSQVQAFLHELSHVAAGTLDIDAPACYGMSGVNYCKLSGKSAYNAENYGMFLQSYLI
jgi:hypothetical protein